MQPRIHLITLGVADLARSRAFYVDGLGWEAAPPSNDDVVFLRTGGAVLGLFPHGELARDANQPVAPPPEVFRGVALAHNVAAREQVAQVLQEAVAAGGTLVKPAQDVFWGGHSGYFADPDGHLWEVAFNPFIPFAPDGALQLG